MDAIDAYSIYNTLNYGKIAATKSPLDDLRPLRPDTVLSVARHPLKPLNHLVDLQEKEQIARRLSLHNLATPEALFNSNYALLEQHQQRTISTDDVIVQLAEHSSESTMALSETAFRKLLRSYATIRHMEFHPTDVCNLSCNDCTYGHDVPELKPLPIQFQFSGIARIAALNPRSMVVIGGGEPTLYKDRNTGSKFQELIDEIDRVMPGIRLALVTNGTHRPKGDWPGRFDWIRVSIDAASPETYEDFRGKPMFERALANYMAYLTYDVRQVGVSFLYAHSNVHEYAQMARMIFERVKQENPEALPKVNIQYRPLRRDPYRYEDTFNEAISPLQLERAVDEVRRLADSSPELKAFLREQTNITAILGGNEHPPHEFGRCYYSQIFHIVRANGDIRPCFIRVNEPDFILGNILRDEPETIALNTLYIAARRKPHCDAHGCRQCHVNHILEEGLANRVKPSDAAAVRNDPMF